MAVFWLLLFSIIIIISFLLAYQSMRDFQEGSRSHSRDYSLFLIRNLAALDQKLLESLHSELFKKAAVISLERLTKGSKVALVIYGPRKILESVQNSLNLLELEDYTRKYTQENLVVFEVAKKNQTTAENIFPGLPKLNKDEQFWWQMLLQPKMHQRKKIFNGQIRVGLILGVGRGELASQFESLGGGVLLKVPRPYSGGQMRQLLLARTLNFAHVQKFEIPEVLNLMG